MRAGDAAHAHIVVEQELPRRRAIVGPRPQQVGLVVAVGGLGRRIHDRPVRHVAEQEVDVLGQFRHVLLGGNRDEAFGVGFAGDVPQLQRVAAAERDLGATVEHLSTGLVVLLDHDNGRAQIARADRGGQAHATAADDDNVCFVVPLNFVASRLLCLRLRADGAGQHGGTRAHDAMLEERAPAQASLAKFGSLSS